MPASTTSIAVCVCVYLSALYLSVCVYHPIQLYTCVCYTLLLYACVYHLYCCLSVCTTLTAVCLYVYTPLCIAVLPVWVFLYCCMLVRACLYHPVPLCDSSLAFLAACYSISRQLQALSMASVQHYQLVLAGVVTGGFHLLKQKSGGHPTIHAGKYS